MARFLFIFSLLICSTLASAQKMYSCNQAYEADLKVYVVNQKYEADLCVYRAAQKYEAVENKGFWFFTEHKYEADKKIFFANQKYEAKLLIYFVKNKYEAGWQKKKSNIYFTNYFISCINFFTRGAIRMSRIPAMKA